MGESGPAAMGEPKNISGPGNPARFNVAKSFQPMPTSSLSAAQSWVDAHSRSVPGEGADAVPVAVDGDTSPYAVRDRLRSAERMIASEIAGLDKALKEVRRQGDEARAYQLAQTLRSARREHREASVAALKAEGTVINFERIRGALISFGEAQDYVSRVLNPVLISSSCS